MSVYGMISVKFLGCGFFYDLFYVFIALLHIYADHDSDRPIAVSCSFLTVIILNVLSMLKDLQDYRQKW